MDTMDVVTRVVAASTYHHNWVMQHMPIFGEELAKTLESDRYAKIVAQLRADGELVTINDTTGNAYLLYYGRDFGDLRNRLSGIQAERYVSMLAHVLMHDVNEGERFNSNDIRAIRERLGLSQEQFAAQLDGVTTSTVQSWEQGRRKPNPEARAKLAALRDTAPIEVR